MKKVRLIAASALVIALMYWLSPARQAKSLRQAEIMTVSPSSVTDFITLKGRVVELDRRELYAKYPSKVVDVNVKQGDTVEKGQILMELRVSRESAAASVFYSEVSGRLQSLDLSEDPSEALGSPEYGGEEGETYWVISPIKGLVMDIYCSAGDAVSGLFPCLAVSDMGKLGVTADVSETNIKKISVGQSCFVTPVSSEKSYSGHVSAIAPYASSASILDSSGEIKTEISVSVNNTAEELRPGYSANVKIITSTGTDSLIVPYSFVAQDDGGEYIMALSDDMTLKKTYITTGRELSDGVELTSGISDGGKLVKYPDKYIDGERVRKK